MTQGHVDPALTLRPEQPEDEPFVFQLFAETRMVAIAPFPWDEPQKNMFLHQQFALQTLHFRTHYPAAACFIIQRGDIPIGRFYVDRAQREIRVIDITLAPAYRARGIGRELLQDLVSEAKTTGQVVRLHVERGNPALRLYQRLGFREIQDAGVYLEMEWRVGQ